MIRTMVFHRKKIWVIFAGCALILSGLAGRLIYLMWAQADYYTQKADDLHERERDIKAVRGKILDARGNVLADNRTVCTISVIHSQIKEPEKVIRVLKEQLSMDEETVRKKVEKVSSIERIKTNVDKTIGDAIREYALNGVKVDEDYRRYYPYGSLASKVLGFTGGDNQGIIGLEVKYDEILAGAAGKNPHSYRCQGSGAGRDRRAAERAGCRRHLANQSGYQYPGVCAAGSFEGDGGEAGREGFCSSYESAERGDLCVRQCAGV